MSCALLLSQKDTPQFGYNERLAYVVWVRALGRMEYEGPMDLAKGSGVTYQWIQKWQRRSDSPKDRTMTRPFLRFLQEPHGWQLEDWLLDGVGEPPRPELWAVWSEARQAVKAAETPVQAEGPKRRTKHDLSDPFIMPAVKRTTSSKSAARRRRA